jgi:hypothetical protein
MKVPFSALVPSPHNLSTAFELFCKTLKLS